MSLQTQVVTAENPSQSGANPPLSPKPQAASVTPASVPSSEQNVEQPKSASDILKRIGSKQEDKVNEPKSELNVDREFNSSDIEKIQDPMARKVVEDLYKSFERGFQKRFQEVAALKKDLESKKNESWTPERVKQLLNDPNFIQSAQAAQSQLAPQTWNGSQEEWSALSEREKAEFTQLRQDNNVLKAQMNSMLTAQEDEKIKTRYPSYDPRKVDDTLRGLSTGEIVATREDIWRVIHFEDAVKQAYELGLKDRQAGLQEKVASSTPSVSQMNVTTAGNLPPEVDKNDIRSIALYRLKQAKEGLLGKR